MANFVSPSNQVSSTLRDSKGVAQVSTILIQSISCTSPSPVASPKAANVDKEMQITVSGKETSEEQQIVEYIGTKASLQADEKRSSEDSVPEEDWLFRFNLTTTQLEKYTGQRFVADNLPQILSVLTEESIFSSQRVRISYALLAWQSILSSSLSSLRDKSIITNTRSIIDAIWKLLSQKTKNFDEELDFSIIARNLSMLLQRECVYNVKTRDHVQSFVIHVLQRFAGMSLLVSDDTYGQQLPDVDEDGIPDSPSLVRCDVLKQLVRCLPLKADDAQELQSLVSIQSLLLSIAQSSRSLQVEIANRLETLAIETHDSDTLFAEHTKELLALCKQGHKDALRALKKCKKFFNSANEQLDDQLDDLLDGLGFEELNEVFQGIAELNPQRLVKRIPRLLRELQSTVVKHKILILGIFVVVALVEVAPFVPLIAPIATSCLSLIPCQVPVFRLFAVVSGAGHESAVLCLSTLVKLSRSGQCTDLNSLLECMNVVKDNVSFCNVFSKETITALQAMSASNPSAVANLLQWNSGKSARRADKMMFISQQPNVRKVVMETSAATTMSPPSSALNAQPQYSSTRLGLFSASKASKATVSPSILSQTSAIAQVTIGNDDEAGDIVPSATPAQSTSNASFVRDGRNPSSTHHGTGALVHGKIVPDRVNESTGESEVTAKRSVGLFSWFRRSPDRNGKEMSSTTVVPLSNSNVVAAHLAPQTTNNTAQQSSLRMSSGGNLIAYNSHVGTGVEIVKAQQHHSGDSSHVLVGINQEQDLQSMFFADSFPQKSDGLEETLTNKQSSEN